MIKRWLLDIIKHGVVPVCHFSFCKAIAGGNMKFARGISLLVRFQPFASDMREVISAMKISTSSERIADQFVTTARRAKRLNARPAIRELAFLEPPYRSALGIFRDSIRA